jgi:hypothetical protein
MGSHHFPIELRGAVGQSLSAIGIFRQQLPYEIILGLRKPERNLCGCSAIGEFYQPFSPYPNNPHKALFLLQLNTQGLIFDRHIPGLPHSLVFDVQVYGWDAGLFTTLPATNTYLRPLHFCPCEAAVFNMSLLLAGPFRLANGKLFTPSPSLSVGLCALPGQTYLQPGQSVAFVLNSLPSPVPEPAPLLLFANGLLATAGVVWRKRRALAR